MRFNAATNGSIESKIVGHPSLVDETPLQVSFTYTVAHTIETFNSAITGIPHEKLALTQA